MRVHGFRRIAAAILTMAGVAAPLSAQNITDADLAKGLSGSDSLAGGVRHLRRAASQPADADHAGQRQPAGAAVDVPGRCRLGSSRRLRSC